MCRCFAATRMPQSRRSPPEHVVPPARSKSRFNGHANWRRAAAGARSCCSARALYGGARFLVRLQHAQSAADAVLRRTQSRAAPAARARLPAYPVVFVGPFQSVGRNGAIKPPAEALRGKLRDALARFDEIQVVSAPRIGPMRRPRAPGHYGLTASVEFEDGRRDQPERAPHRRADGQRRLCAHLQPRPPQRRCAASGRGCDRARGVGRAGAALWHHPGARAREGVRGGETQYRCLIEAYEYWRSYDPQQHRRARDCLERATEGDARICARIRGARPDRRWRNIAAASNLAAGRSAGAAARAAGRAARRRAQAGQRARPPGAVERAVRARRLSARDRGRRARRDAQSLRSRTFSPITAPCWSRSASRSGARG